MGWQLITSSEDIIVYERKFRGYTTRIEARNETNEWLVYVIYFNDKGLNVTEEFEAQTKEDAMKLITSLQQRPNITLRSLQDRMLKHKKRTEVNIKRSYKEYNVEKWFFGINGDKPINFMVIRFYDTIEIDVVMHERYRLYEQKVLDTMLDNLGIDTTDEDVKMSCYYFNKYHHSAQELKKKIMLGRLEFDFSEK